MLLYVLDVNIPDVTTPRVSPQISRLGFPNHERVFSTNPIMSLYPVLQCQLLRPKSSVVSGETLGAVLH